MIPGDAAVAAAEAAPRSLGFIKAPGSGAVLKDVLYDGFVDEFWSEVDEDEERIDPLDGGVGGVPLRFSDISC